MISMGNGQASYLSGGRFLAPVPRSSTRAPQEGTCSTQTTLKL